MPSDLLICDFVQGPEFLASLVLNTEQILTHQLVTNPFEEAEPEDSTTVAGNPEECADVADKPEECAAVSG